MMHREAIFYEICTKKKFEREFPTCLSHETLNISACSFQDAVSLLSLQWFKDKINQASALISLNFTINFEKSKIALVEIKAKSEIFLKDNQYLLTIAFKSETQVFVCWKNDTNINVVELSSLETDLQNIFITLLISSNGMFKCSLRW